MKSVNLKSLGVLLLAFSLTTAVMAENKKVDVNKSKVEWTGKKLTGSHNGTINVKEGSLEVDNGKLSGGKVVMDMPSIKVLDLTDADSNGKLTGHLKSDDFFSVATHPTSTLEITKVEGTTTNHTITGNLTIKGKTNPVSFTATSAKEGQSLVYHGEIIVDRSKFDVRYGSKSFFNDIGDKAINDEFTLDFHLVTQ
ncbi:MAG TPA: YceI family protein [Prolixibacteraceae bacterium]|nr:YceI family protein [Prolixibacteraceae bacterium]